MKVYILQRLIQLIPVVFGISVTTFLLIHFVPVDPAEVYLRLSGIPPTDEVVAVMRTKLGLDRPIHVRFLDWLWRAFHLDFGVSFVTKEPVLQEMLHYFPATLELTVYALILMLALSVPIGVLAALYKESFFDQGSRVLSFIGASMPSFWLGLLLMHSLAFKLDLFPVMGRGTLAHVVLPALTLSLGQAALYTRLLRASMLENLQQPYVLYARVRGLRERLIIGRHVLKNALLPVVTTLGMSVGHLLGGVVIVESVFAWPGVGRYCVSSILNRDYPVIQFYVCFMAVIFVLCNLLVDVAYSYLDPRIRIR
jgi:peptide/nickel transport system permease protein/nickel transport system permease protein